VHALPFTLALLAALALAAPLTQSLRANGLTRENYRGRVLPFPFGVLIVAAAFVALVPLALLDRLADADVYPDHLKLVLLFVPGVALLGLIDDALSGPSRGWRGHGAAVLGGGFSTGALKAVGTLGLALLVASGLPGSDIDFLLATAVLVLATNLFNLLDLRPGRSVKAFVILGAGLSLGSWDAAPLAALGLFAAPALVAGAYDVRERAMLGDTGSNLLGALAGLWLVLTLDTTGQIVALVLLAAITAYGEFRSISGFVEKSPLLRRLDSLGRPA
jgi:UDP-N-acetylmuramyl pentapeptide phosphotransferase/UDP-N-acetylglucosamine-1-phosphate transferase